MSPSAPRVAFAPCGLSCQIHFIRQPNTTILGDPFTAQAGLDLVQGHYVEAGIDAGGVLLSFVGLGVAAKAIKLAREARLAKNAEALTVDAAGIRGLATETADVSQYGRVKLSKGTRAKIWERSKAPDGKVYDPTGVEIKPGEPWQAGHVPGHKFFDAQQRAASQGWDQDMWKAYQRDPDIYRPEKAKTNLGHQHESDW